MERLVRPPQLEETTSARRHQAGIAHAIGVFDELSAARLLAEAASHGLAPALFDVDAVVSGQPGALEAAFRTWTLEFWLLYRTHPNLAHTALELKEAHVLFADELADAVRRASLVGWAPAMQEMIPKHPHYALTRAALAKETRPKKRAQLTLALQRWREDRLPRDARTYVRVNIPEYSLRVWRTGELAREHRAIVGFTGEKKDKRGHNVGGNRTPMMVSTVQRVILNPSWAVPSRVLRDMRQQLAQPGYAEARGYRLTKLKDGRDRLIQLPGRRNALGKVKFRLDNQDAIYLHDTNMRRLFSKEYRALSHGCVRVQKPLELASWLLANDGTSAAVVDRARKDDKTQELPLVRPLPLVLAYNTVTFDDKGQPVYLRDIYGYDEAWRRGRLPYYQEDRWRARKRDEALRERIARVDSAQSSGQKRSP